MAKAAALRHAPEGDSLIPQVSASIVTHDDAECLPDFLNSLSRQTGVAWEAFFFENGATPESCNLIDHASLGELTVSEENVGFSRGHNHNLTRCRGQYVLLLNPDVEFSPSLFRDLAGFLDAHPEYAIAGPRIVEGSAALPFPPRLFYPGEGMVALERGLRRTEIAWVNGCCMIIRREAFEKLGGFDPDFFLYQSETDLCRRGRELGLRIGYAGNISVHHIHRQSQKGDSDYAYSRKLFAGNALFWEKHYEPHDVLRMVWFQYRVSQLLLLVVRAVMPLLRMPPVLGEARLRARRDVCKEWLEERQRREGLSGPGPGRIAWRQVEIIAEWIRRRQFPLDDY